MNGPVPSWRKEESRIYIRDAVFLILTILFSVILAELLIVKENATAVDRVFTYLLVFIPLGIFNYIAHYYYRNRRIKMTGNLRSSFRYQLSVAFLLVSVIPSIPIFLMSSSMIQRLVEGVFRVDVAGAMTSADEVIAYYKSEEEKRFLNQFKNNPDRLFSNIHPNPDLIKKLHSENLQEKEVDYVALMKEGRLVFETKPIFKNKPVPGFTLMEDGEIGRFPLQLRKMEMILFSFPLRGKDNFLILGHRMHPPVEADAHQFESVYSRLENESIWQVEIPTNLRLGLGFIFVTMIAVALIVSLVIARQISLPIVAIAQATRDIADGKLDTTIDIQARGEIGVLIDSFNQMTSELQSLRSRLLHTQRVAAWQEVAKRLAHEIKNPLTPIQLSAERILRRLEKPNRGDLTRVLRTGAHTIIDQVSTLKSMVEEFADFARLPSARPISGSLEEVVSEAVHLYRGTPGISVEVMLSGKLPKIEFDKNLIIGMINNLIKNAVEAIQLNPDENQRTGKVRISTGLHREGNRNYIMLRVEDSGPGISSDVSERIFEPYFSTKGDQGSGLGLAVVERAVTEHDARIHVETSELGGARFTVLFRVRESGGKKG